MESSERTFLAKGKAPGTLYLSFSVIPVNRILTSRLTILESGPAFTRIVRMNNTLPDVSLQTNNLWLRRPKKKKKKENSEVLVSGKNRRPSRPFHYWMKAKLVNIKDLIVIAKTQFNITSDFELQTYRDTMNHWIILPYNSLTPRQ